MSSEEVTSRARPLKPFISNYSLTSVDVPAQETHQAADLKTDDANLPEGGPAGE